MTYQSLYRKYRPQNFDDVIGQESIVTALQNAVLKNKISHAFLFTGPRGTGKTTTAKLLAKAINCENEDAVICGVCDNCKEASQGTHPDIVEIDAASNNGVEEIRNLIERVKFMPIEGRYKVYIIDEVHMLSQGAFNALLKTLEEPPEHVVFILATTEIHKVLPTIISRCQRFDFSRISNKQIADRLEKISALEKREMEDNAAELIASLSAGGMRNALTILEQAMIFNEGEISVRSVYDNNGMVLPEEKIKLFESLLSEDITPLIEVLEIVIDKTVDVSRFVMELISGLKDSLVYRYTKNDDYININDKEFVASVQTMFSNQEIVKMINVLLDYHEKIRFSSTPFVHLEIAMIELFERFKDKESFTNSKPLTEEKVIKENLTQEKTWEKEIVEKPSAPIPQQIIPKTSLSEEKEIEASPEKSEETKSKEIKPQTQVDLFETEPQKEIQSSDKLDLTIEEIVQFMCSGDRAIRQKDEAEFNDIKDYLSSPQWAKESNLLNNSQVVISGERFLVVVTKNQSQSRAILDEINLYDLISFTEEILGTPKQVFAITQHQYKDAIEVFKDLASKNNLPEPLSSDSFITHDEDYVDETEERLLNLFGDNLEIKES